MHKDLSGQVIGLITLIKRIPNNKKQNIRYLGKCVCGNIKEYDIGNLKRRLEVKNDLKCGCNNYKKPFGESMFNNLILRYINSAKKKKLEFTINKEIFKELIKQNCFYCGTEPKSILKHPRSNGDCIYNGLDRVDNNLGYIINNVVTCCETCNKAKLKQSQKEFYNWIRKVYNYNLVKQTILNSN